MRYQTCNTIILGKALFRILELLYQILYDSPFPFILTFTGVKKLPFASYKETRQRECRGLIFGAFCHGGFK